MKVSNLTVVYSVTLSMCRLKVSYFRWLKNRLSKTRIHTKNRNKREFCKLKIKKKQKTHNVQTMHKYGHESSSHQRTDTNVNHRKN